MAAHRENNVGGRETAPNARLPGWFTFFEKNGIFLLTKVRPDYILRLAEKGKKQTLSTVLIT
jgi:hypothetical protein